MNTSEGCSEIYNWQFSVKYLALSRNAVINLVAVIWTFSNEEVLFATQAAYNH